MDDKVLVQLPFCKRDEVEAEIRRIARTETIAIITLDHAKDRMLQRGITSRQVLRVLAEGALDSPIEWDTSKDKGWKCRFCRTTAGLKVTVVVKLIETGGRRCLVITVW
jgi:hypothetical protein